jgi:hypothetical protein
MTDGMVRFLDFDSGGEAVVYVRRIKATGRICLALSHSADGDLECCFGAAEARNIAMLLVDAANAADPRPRPGAGDS